jgi:hypothetical protein
MLLQHKYIWEGMLQIMLVTLVNILTDLDSPVPWVLTNTGLVSASGGYSQFEIPAVDLSSHPQLGVVEMEVILEATRYILGTIIYLMGETRRITTMLRITLIQHYYHQVYPQFLAGMSSCIVWYQEADSGGASYQG